MIDWGKHFDHVYCFCYLGSKNSSEKREALDYEFHRVNLDTPGLTTMVYTTRDPWEDKLAVQLAPRTTEADSNKGFVNLGLATARVLREALALGYSRVLLLEDDVRFLKDVNTIRASLEALPLYDLVMFDKFLPWGLSNENYRKYVDAHRINAFYFEGYGLDTKSGAGFALTRAGMKWLLGLLESDAPENGPRPSDYYFNRMLSRAVADRNLLVQQMYDGSMARLYIGKDGGNPHLKGYAPIGINMEDYAMAESTRKNRLFISVYAITKNESKFVDRWMDSMQEADEVVVLDTGSTDDTVEKLRARGAKVEVREFKPWRFDTSRNASMELCSPEADILVCTDLDEVLNKGWRGALEKAWLKAKAEGRDPTTATYWYTWNFTPDGKPDRRFIYEKVHKPGVCKWTHPVHEILSYDGRKETVFVEGMELEHHPDNAKSRASYLPLLEMSVEEDPEDDRNMHYLGREYMFKGMWQKAVDTLQRHLNLPRAKWRAERAASMRFMGRCYAAMGKDLTAELWYRRACDEEPSVRESAVEFAQFLYDRKAPWTQLRAACERALRVTERAGSYLTEAEAWGSKPHDLLSVALWNLGDFKGALKAAEKALELEPGNERIRKNVENIRKAATRC